jgi:hypothetical protein
MSVKNKKVKNLAKSLQNQLDIDSVTSWHDLRTVLKTKADLSKNMLNWVTGVVYRSIRKEKTPVFNIYLNKILNNKKRGLKLFHESFKEEISTA